MPVAAGNVAVFVPATATEFKVIVPLVEPFKPCALVFNVPVEGIKLNFVELVVSLVIVPLVAVVKVG